MFYFVEDTFCGIAVAVSFVAKAEIEAMKSGVEPWRFIDEELGVFDVVFLIGLERKALVTTVVWAGNSRA